MFGKLKEKLKKTLSVFSKKAKEEVSEEPAEEKKDEIVEEKVEEVKEEPVEEKKEEKKEIKKEIKEKPKPEVKKEEIKPEPIKEEPKEPEPVKEEPKKGFFAKAKEFVSTKKISADKFDNLFWDLELALLENNVSVEVIEKIKTDLKEELVDKPLPRNVEGKIEETLKKSLEEVLDIDKIDLLGKIKTKKPFIIAFFGINGSGKTTTIAKVAHLLKQKGLTSVLAAADTFRAAAIQQLEEHADKLKLKMIKHDYGADAAAVAFDAVKYAEKQGLDVVLIDTAGRLHSDVNLMDELKKIVRVVDPDMKIFVGESITGNDCVEQASKFSEQIGIDGLVLTKADVDEKGGAAISVSFITKKPILFIGTGQEYDKLKEFDSDLVLNSLGLK
ncbi:signal recognition particle-docking protein FtsY [Candidatus Woesearchaeota archaeon]|nr:signal recognition particle-docking protein FtsY [Candidatus Woesearchaeota archaeon]